MLILVKLTTIKISRWKLKQNILTVTLNLYKLNWLYLFCVLKWKRIALKIDLFRSYWNDARLTQSFCIGADSAVIFILPLSMLWSFAVVVICWLCVLLCSAAIWGAQCRTCRTSHTTPHKEVKFERIINCNGSNLRKA